MRISPNIWVSNVSGRYGRAVGLNLPGLTEPGYGRRSNLQVDLLVLSSLRARRPQLAIRDSSISRLERTAIQIQGVY